MSRACDHAKRTIFLPGKLGYLEYDTLRLLPYILNYLTSEACDTRHGARYGCPTSGYVWDILRLRLGQNKISHCGLPSQRTSSKLAVPGMSCTDNLVDLQNTEEMYMCRTAMAWGSAAAHNLAAYSHSEQGFATHFNMYPEVQLPSPNGSLGHTRGHEVK